MAAVDSVSAKCHECIRIMRDIISRLSNVNQADHQVRPEQVTDELDRFSLWIGNIGALHQETSPLSLEFRLLQEEEVLGHIKRLLDNFAEVTGELLEIVSGEREGDKALRVRVDDDVKDEEAEGEILELIKEIADCTRRLFRMSSIIRQAAPTDLFSKALSRDRYRFNEQFDISHVGEKYSKLAADDMSWLRVRLGRAITQRRHYLSYIYDHRNKLEAPEPEPAVPRETGLSQAHPSLPRLVPICDSSSRPSTLLTTATSIQAGFISAEVLAEGEVSDYEDDVKSYTTISRSVEGDIDNLLIDRIPPLNKLRQGAKGEVECPFCFRMKKFENEKRWRKHVFSDLRTYVCTSKDCDGPYFNEINDWFRHEMENHFVYYACAVCPGKTYRHEDHYLSHMRKSHPAILSTGDVKPILDIARQPMKEIPADSCPFCVEWKDRIRQQTTITTDGPDSVICVTPTVFKRHLASHLEALSLFAIPIDSSDDRDAGSNKAIEDETRQSQCRSNLSTLSFESQPLDSDDDDQYSLIRDGVDVDAQSGIYGSALYSASLKGLEDIVRTLIQNGADVNAQGGEYGNALQAASQKGYKDIVQILLENGADVNAQGGEYGNALYAASLKGREGIVLTLIQNGADVNIQGGEYGNALQAASKEGHESIVQILLENGADMNVQDGEYSNAIKILKHIVAIQKQTLAETHPGRLALQHKLAIAYQANGQIQEAIKILEHVVAIKKQTLAETHPDRLALQHGLALTYQANGQIQEAIEILEHVVAIKKQTLAETHPDRLASQYELAYAYQTNNQVQKAIKILEHIVAIQKKILAETHPDRLSAQHGLALAYQANGQVQKAIKILEHIVAIQKESLAETHPDRLSSQHGLALAYQANGQIQEAIKILEHVVAIRKETLAETHPDRLASQYELASTYQANGQVQEAIKILEHAIADEKEILGDSLSQLVSQHKLARAYQANGQVKEAIKILEHVVAIRKQTLAESHPDRLASQHELARAYQAEG